MTEDIGKARHQASLASVPSTLSTRLFDLVMCDMADGECISTLVCFIAGLVLIACPSSTVALAGYERLRYLSDDAWGQVFLLLGTLSSFSMIKGSVFLRRAAVVSHCLFFVYWGTSITYALPQAMVGWLWLVLSLSSGWSFLKLVRLEDRGGATYRAGA